jgi:hypothetical protein
VYFVEWCDGVHPRRVAFLTVGIGRFEEEDAGERQAFCLQWTTDGMALCREGEREDEEA